MKFAQMILEQIGLLVISYCKPSENFSALGRERSVGGQEKHISVYLEAVIKSLLDYRTHNSHSLNSPSESLSGQKHATEILHSAGFSCLSYSWHTH